MTEGLRTVVIDPDDKAPNTSTFKLLGSSRFGLAVILFFGFVNLYALRINISVAIVCMVNQTAAQGQFVENISLNVNHGLNCSNELDFGSRTVYEDGKFLWTKQMQGLILSSTFWGLILTEFSGGVLATKYGSKRVLLVTTAMAAIATLLCPVAAEVSPIFLMAMRFILGLCQGLYLPATTAIWGIWAPPLERSKLISATFAGMDFGSLVGLGVSGLLCQYVGWPSIFYISGGASVLWCVSCFFLAYDTPEKHPRISAAEKKYIRHSLLGHGVHHKKKDLRIPWRDFVRSGPFWAVIILDFTLAWTVFTFMTGIPSYINDVLKLDIKSNGLFSAVMYLLTWLFHTSTGIISDIFRSRKILSTTAVRKIMLSIGMVSFSAFVIALGFIDCTQPILALSLLTTAVAFTGCCVSVQFCNYVDIAPRYSGIISGISNTFATTAGMIAPIVVGILTKHRTQEEWRTVFIICACIGLLGTLVFLIIGSGEVQPWAVVELRPKQDSEKPDNTFRLITNQNFELNPN